MMKQSKQKKLNAAGWKAGCAREFLALTTGEEAYIEMKLALSEMLKARRLKRKLSRAKFAELIESSQSRVAKMESGDPSVSIDLLLISLFSLGASRRDVAKAISLGCTAIREKRRSATLGALVGIIGRTDNRF